MDRNKPNAICEHSYTRQVPVSPKNSSEKIHVGNKFKKIQDKIFRKKLQRKIKWMIYWSDSKLYFQVKTDLESREAKYKIFCE